MSCGIILGILCGKSVSVSAEEKVTVGTNAEYAPFEYLDSDGKLTGFDYELLEAIAEEENLELVWKDMPFDSLIGSMEAGDIKIIAAAVGPTKEREKKYGLFGCVLYGISKYYFSERQTCGGF